MLTTVANYHKSGDHRILLILGLIVTIYRDKKLTFPIEVCQHAGYTFLLYGYCPGLTSGDATSETTARILFNFISCLSTRLEFLKRKILPTGPNGKR